MDHTLPIKFLLNDFKKELVDELVIKLSQSKLNNDDSNSIEQNKSENELAIKLSQSKLSQSKLNNDDSIDKNKPENELKFKLNWELKEKLILILNDFTSLLNGDKNSIEKLNQESNSLIHRLIDIPFKLDNDDQIPSTNNQLKPILIIDFKMRKELNDLLYRNKNFSIIYRDNVSDDAKLNLIKENNRFVQALNNLPIKMLVEDSTGDDQLVAKSEFDKEITEFNKKITKYEARIAELIKEIYNKYETAFIFEFKDIDSFVNRSDNIYFFPSFKCSGLNWQIRIIHEDSKILKFYLVLLNDNTSNLQTNTKLTIINQEKKFSDLITSLSSDGYCYYSSASKYKEFKESLTYEYLKNNGFIKDDKIILQFYMKAEW